MRIEALELMRNIRDKMSEEINSMSWEEEQIYLKKHIKVFEFLVKESPDKSTEENQD